MEHTTENQTSFSASTAGIITRFSVYTVGVALLMFSFPWLAEQYGAAGFKEGGAVEWAQLVLVASMAVIFLRESFVTRGLRELFLLFACFLGFVSIREMDFILDVIPFLTWKYAYVLILYAAYIGFANSQAFKEQVACFIRFRSFALLWAGFMIAIPFAQLVGNGDFLQALVADYSRDYKRVIEEVGELVGYLLMLLASIEVVLDARANPAPR